MLLWGVKRPAARRYREMHGADRFPALYGFDPVIRSRARQVDTAFQMQGAGVTTGFLRVLPDAPASRWQGAFDTLLALGTHYPLGRSPVERVDRQSWTGARQCSVKRGRARGGKKFA